MRFRVSALVAGLLITQPAMAQWHYQGSESEFGDDGLHLALTAKGAYALGIRCRGSTLQAMYMTPDRSIPDDNFEAVNATKPKMKVRIDKGDVIELDVDLAETNGTISAISDIDRDLLNSLRDAKRNVAVVLELIGTNYHENSFGVRGSTKAIDQVIVGCGLDGEQ